MDRTAIASAPWYSKRSEYKRLKSSANLRRMSEIPNLRVIIEELIDYKTQNLKISIEKLEKSHARLDKRLQKLEEVVNDIYYHPDIGCAMKEAKEDFKIHSQKQHSLED